MFYSDLYIDEEIERIADDWDYLNEKVVGRFLGFRPEGDSIFGVRHVVDRAPGDAGGEAAKGPLDLVKSRRNLEIGPDGFLEVARHPLAAHVTVSGTPHHTEHLFGYWHINDKDEIILPLPPYQPDAPAHLLVIMGKPTGTETDKMAWYCERCCNLMFMRELQTGVVGFHRYWQWERDVVRDFNADERNRICTECQHVNPRGYSAFAHADTDEEREARIAW